jgi:hypothetical protein
LTRLLNHKAYQVRSNLVDGLPPRLGSSEPSSTPSPSLSEPRLMAVSTPPLSEPRPRLRRPGRVSESSASPPAPRLLLKRPGSAPESAPSSSAARPRMVRLAP